MSRIACLRLPSVFLALTCGCVGTVREVGPPDREIRVDAGVAAGDGGMLAPGCGNGTIDPGETCDPASSCPSSCDDGVACTSDRLTGSPASCNARCESAPIDACAAGDGCCPSGCTSASDSDCSASCGDGTLDPGETCDPPGSCPTSCNDGDACTTDMLVGSASTCSADCASVAITMCRGGDGCCPAGCARPGDTDCSASCGDGTVDAGETCDPPGSCPTSCNDGNACTTDMLTGSAAACNAACTNTAITMCRTGDGCCPSGCTSATDGECMARCGDGRVDPGETCDPVASCPVTCDDGNTCTTDRLMGSAPMCTASCTNTAITMCTGGDGCCPSGCTTATDTDCRIDCTVASSWPAAWVMLEDSTLAEINRRRAMGANCGGTDYPPAGPLTMQAQLRQAARCHSADMGENNFFSHTGSDGSDPGARIRRAGYAPRTWGENIAAGYSTVTDVVQGWMDSPGHCRNIMNDSFNETGVGYGNYPGTMYRHYWTQTFGAR